MLQLYISGGGGIRTHVTSRPPVFKTGAIDRSATPPKHRQDYGDRDECVEDPRAPPSVQGALPRTGSPRHGRGAPREPAGPAIPRRWTKALSPRTPPLVSSNALPAHVVQRQPILYTTFGRTPLLSPSGLRPCAFRGEDPGPGTDHVPTGTEPWAVPRGCQSTVQRKPQALNSSPAEFMVPRARGRPP